MMSAGQTVAARHFRDGICILKGNCELHGKEFVILHSKISASRL